MKIIEQSHEIEFLTPNATKIIEKCARTCYASESKICEGSDIEIVRKLVSRGHFAMVEMCDMIVRFVTDIGVSREFARHRLTTPVPPSEAERSTRYVRFDCVEFIRPVWFKASDVNKMETRSSVWNWCCLQSERAYGEMLRYRATPQEARQCLNLSVATEFCYKTNLREWHEILRLRTDKAAHPQMRAMMIPLLNEMKQRVPVVFDDIEVKE